jgi:hypothetical protein
VKASSASSVRILREHTSLFVDDVQNNVVSHHSSTTRLGCCCCWCCWVLLVLLGAAGCCWCCWCCWVLLVRAAPGSKACTRLSECYLGLNW